MNTNVVNKIDALIEEASFREQAIAAQLKGLTPQQLAELPNNTGKIALKTWFKKAAIGGAGGALGAVGLGTSIGSYLNNRTAANMTPAEISKNSKEFEKNYGKEYSQNVLKMGPENFS